MLGETLFTECRLPAEAPPMLTFERDVPGGAACAADDVCRRVAGEDLPLVGPLPADPQEDTAVGRRVHALRPVGEL